MTAESCCNRAIGKDYELKGEKKMMESKQNVIIDWTNYPVWVRYVAMDSHEAEGARWWMYAERPTCREQTWEVAIGFGVAQVPKGAEPIGFAGDWKDSLFRREVEIRRTYNGDTLICEVEVPTDKTIKENEPSTVDEVTDMTERQLWCSVYVETMKTRLTADAPTSWDLADQAVAEYRKRYGAERIG